MSGFRYFLRGLPVVLCRVLGSEGLDSFLLHSLSALILAQIYSKDFQGSAFQISYRP